VVTWPGAMLPAFSVAQDRSGTRVSIREHNLSDVC